MNRSKAADQLFIGKLTEIILSNLRNENFGVKELSHLMGLSQSTLNHRLHSINQKSINQFIREVRLQKAMEILQSEDITAAEVSYRVGFSSPAYFNSCFHEFFGYPPGHIKTAVNSSFVDDLTEPVTFSRDTRENKRYIFILKISGILLLVGLVLIATILGYPLLIRDYIKDSLPSKNGRISVAVMPYKNMTGDASLNKWQVGIQDNLITNLSNNPKDLKVIQTESIRILFQKEGLNDYSKIRRSDTISILRKLHTDVIIFGSINNSNSLIRINTRLINPGTREVFKSFQVEGDRNSILKIIDSISREIKEYFIFSKIITERVNEDQEAILSTHSAEAYQYLKDGESALARRDYSTAKNFFSKALAIDSGYIYPTLCLAWTYLMLGMPEEGKKWCLKAYKQENSLTQIQKIYTDLVHACFFKTPYEVINYLRLLREIDDQTPYSYFLMGKSYFELQQYENAIPEFEKSLEIYSKRLVKPFYIANYTDLSAAYVQTGQIRKAKRILKKAEKDFPDEPSIIKSQLILALILKDTVKEKTYIVKYNELCLETSVSEAEIAENLAGVFSEAGFPDKAEEYYQQSLSIEPENPRFIYNLAFFLIDNDRAVDIGLQLIGKALERDPENYLFLDCKAWGLYKKGKFTEALNLLEKCWQLRPIYNHRIYLHLDKARKAVPKKTIPLS